MSDVVVVAIVAAIPGVVAAVVSLFNHQKLQSVEIQMDGRLSQLLEITKNASYASGAKAGKAEAEEAHSKT